MKVAVLVVSSALVLGACAGTGQYQNIGAGTGGLLGGAGGWFGTKALLNNVGNLNPKQRKFAQAGGGVLGALFGGLVGGGVGKAYDNGNSIQQNRNGILQNQQAIGQNRQMIDRNGNVYFLQNQGQNNNLNCQTRNNYVVCNSY